MMNIKPSTGKPDGRALAWGGLLTALSVIFVFAASMAPTANLAFYALASLCTAIAVVRLGSKTAVTMVAAASLLTAFWPGFWLALPYYCLFGPYPVVKALIEKSTAKYIPVLAGKLVSATVMSGLAILLTIRFAGLRLEELFTMPFDIKLTGGLLWIAAAAILEIGLFIYDYGLTLLITWYMKHLHYRF
jgi:hypothetical protein